MKLQRIKRNTPQKLSKQIAIHNNVLAQKDLYYTLLNFNLIEKAAELALNSRLHLDPVYDIIEIKGISKDNLVAKVYSLLEKQQFEFQNIFSVDIPKEKGTYRKLDYVPIEQYVMKFMIGLILKDKVKFNDNVYGGKEDVFEKLKGTIYHDTGQLFNEWQKECIDSGKFSWVAILDVKNYYDTLDISKIHSSIILNISNDQSPIFNQFIKSVVNEINIGNRIDDFFQNLYLSDIDNLFNSSSTEYGRVTDDFRIFGNSKDDVKKSFDILKSELGKLGLTVNFEKQFTEYKQEKVDQIDLGYFRGTLSSEDYWSSTPFLEVNKIDQVETENVLRLFSNTDNAGVTSRYYFNEHPKSITLKDEIDGKSGYLSNNRDIYDIIQAIEQDHAINYDQKLLQELESIIKYTFGNQNHYKRVVNSYILALTRSNSVAIEKSLKSISKTLEYSLYKKYLFLHCLFISLENEKNISFEKITSLNHAFKNTVLQVIADGLYSERTTPIYFKSITTYIFDHDLLNVTNEDNIDWKDNEFWLKYLTTKKENDWAYYMYIPNMCDYLENWLEFDRNLNLLYAKSLSKDSNYREAGRRFFSLAVQDGKVVDVDLTFNVAYCLAEIGKNQQAIKFYSLYINNYHSAAARNNRGLLYKELEQFDTAEDDFKEALRLEEDEELYLSNLLNLYNDQHRYMDIDNMLNQYHLDKMDVKFLKLKATALAKLKQRDEALSAIKAYNAKIQFESEDKKEERVTEIIKILNE
ncbi:hypothetical protein OAG16_03790 [Saprospiraceae bacterium]|nr:hypothetical protein [Saprospiraceae bacterium]